MIINPLNAELNPICHLLALLGAHHILHVSRIRVKQEVGQSTVLAKYVVLTAVLLKNTACYDIMLYILHMYFPTFQKIIVPWCLHLQGQVLHAEGGLDQK